MPDIIPVISPLPGVEGLIVATGFSGHGFGIGPGAGRLVADMVCNETPLVDPSPFHISRFSDGTKSALKTGNKPEEVPGTSMCLEPIILFICAASMQHEWIEFDV